MLTARLLPSIIIIAISYIASAFSRIRRRSLDTFYTLRGVYSHPDSLTSLTYEDEARRRRAVYLRDFTCSFSVFSSRSR